MKKEIAKKVGIWFLAFSLFMAHVFFRSVAHADPGEGWKRIQAKNGECQIAFPTFPQVIQQSLPLKEGGKHLTYDIYLAPFEDRGVFLLLIATHPGPLAEGHETLGLEGLMRGIVGRNPENELVFSKWADFLTHPSVAFLVQNGKSYFRAQALVIGNQLFLIAMEGKRGTMDEGVFAYFLESFRLLSKKKN